MSDTLTMDAAQARRRVLRESVGLLVTTAVIGVGFLGPLVIILANAVPQVAAALPQPARDVTFYMDGLAGDADDLTEGADGEGTSFDEDDAAAWDEVAADAAEEGEVDGQDEANEAAKSTTPEPANSPPPEPASTETQAAPEPQPPKEGDDADAGEATDGDPDADGEEDRTATLATAATQDKAKKKGRSGRCAEKHPDIKQVMDDYWTVNESLIDWYTEDMKRFNSLGYSRRFHEGEIKGWMVGGFGCRSPLWKGGLRSKDVLQTVNGKKTNNVLQLFAIWASERHKKRFEIIVLRKGEPVRLRYKIVSTKKAG